MSTKKVDAYQIRIHRQQTNLDFWLPKKQCAHLVRQSHKMENVPNNRLAVNRPLRSNSSIVGNYHPILRTVYIVFSILKRIEIGVRKVACIEHCILIKSQNNTHRVDVPGGEQNKN